MDGRKEDNLEWWLLRDSGLLSVIENHNRLPSRFVHVTPAAGNYSGQSNGFQNPNLRDSDRFQVNINHPVTPATGNYYSDGFLNPNIGDSDRFQVNINPDLSLYVDLETAFGGMSLSSNQSNNNFPAASSRIGTGMGMGCVSPYGNLNRMEAYGRGYDRNLTMNNGFEGGFGDLNSNGFRVRSNNTGLVDYNLTNNNLNNIYPPTTQDHQRRSLLFSSLEELRGKIPLVVTKDQHSCRVLQKKLEEGKPDDIEMIFSEVKNHVCELMVDQSGNYLVQKLFQVCNPQQMTELLAFVIRDQCRLMAICLDMHGTRAVQTMLRHLTTVEQRAVVVAALRHITVTLTKSVNGYHVIQHCVKFFSNEEKKQILNVVADNCVDIATDRSGCCVLQHCVENADAQSRERLVAEITVNALVLSEHPYGNYVVQNILGLRIPHYRSEIVRQLAGRFVHLSMNKYGSNVVEKCLKECSSSSGESEARIIIEEIVSSPNFLMVLQDPFGNYVVQSALAVSKGALRFALVNIINMHYPSLHSHPHGKRVLAKTTRTGNKLI
ncbi:PREDICTED: putative pumilio homolog 8, chloroplastic [Ipomoea nil]|uniref:putative pumilio homolog 8, chloroplastic n=1 Tax=Ipomoea nil TaxID=35883 RepID=UPI000900D2A8|nr:PREDICTED: putative pumilio homolog 8, chloroplastic [Ipomoea nil]